ncbi:polysaccharide lyase 8 family protein [Massilia terrae]|uniref:Polysaccharide lyase 8 family protein n=1 Tax=Massilia terrae TaxID=1811224 RepID=A0ABT2CT67_9BURK|nr:polysaccharide lyase 8 family protein [Massilia terrae]MCS0657183.1 polysaccharide lyase 8 family protein [Massilia terrae]
MQSAKKNWWLACVLAGSLVPAAALAGDEFDAMRERWQVKLVGTAAQDRGDSSVAQQLLSQSDAAQRALDGMARDPDAKALWKDLARFDDPYPIKASAAVTANAARLEQMARAFAAPGTPSWHDARLGAGLAVGLDWLVRHYYTAGRHEFGNWWDWQIGTPLLLLNVLTLADEAVPAELRRRTLEAVNWHVPDARYKTLADGKVDRKWAEEGANLLDKSLVMVLSGMLGKDGERIAAGRDGLALTLDYATSGNGFYRDGSFIQHGHVAYNGGYGAVALADYARLLYILGDSEWALRDPRAPRIFQWALEGFAAPIIDGAMPDALRGRGVSRHGQTDHKVGRGMAASLAVIADQAPPEQRAALRAAIKGWMQRDRTFGANYLGGADGKEVGLYERGLLQQIAADPATRAAAEEEGARIYASMDRAILRGRGFAAVLSMSSPRISSFEAGNSENLHPWWSGMGVLQLYGPDQAQFDGNYWATIDLQRLPGTTTDHSGQGRPVEWKKYPNSDTWVGGAALGKYAALGMVFSLRDVTGSDLHGRKAWFQLGDRVLALGSGIGGGQGQVETIVENRRLADPAGARLLVNGQPLGNGSVASARWAHLQDDKAGSSIGYVFPQAMPVRAERSERSGSWRDINGLSGPAGVVRDSYQVLGIPQGSPRYAYLLLPNASVEATRAAAGDPGLRIEANDEHAAAVSEPGEGVYAADLWQAGSAPRGGRDYVWSSAPAAVVASVAAGRLRLAIAEPTQGEKVLEVRLAQPVAHVVKLGAGVTVLATAPQLRLRIDTAGAAGASFNAEFILP